MNHRHPFFLAFALASMAFIGCGDDDGDDFVPTDAFTPDDAGSADDAGTETDGSMGADDFLSRGRAVWLVGCECESDADLRAACIDDADKISAQVATEGECVVDAFDDPGAADFVSCFEDTTDTLESCLDVADCDATAVAACYDGWDPAIEACPQPPDSVWTAVEACFD